MAKFGSYYSLCPLIDNKSLLGVSEDVEKGSVIVTLGKNIAIKYKLADQKQICSWRTKEKFTSPIIYDKTRARYVAVFNHSYIKLWHGDEDQHLDKLKKYKFNSQINTIACVKGVIFIIFQNGEIISLENALESRKTLTPTNIISSSEQIIDVLYSDKNADFYFAIIAKSDDELNIYWTIYNAKKSKFLKVKLQRDDCVLKGYVLHRDVNDVLFLSIWSDGRVFARPMSSDSTHTSLGDIYTVTEAISTKNFISIVSLNEHYIALYGASANEEGATLIIYNTQFKVNQTKQPFKLFAADSKLVCIDNNLFLPTGQNLAVIPFCLDTEQLAALVGSHKQIENDPDISIVEDLEVVNWGETSQNIIKYNPPNNIKAATLDLLKMGLTEDLIYEALLAEIIENRSVDQLLSCLKYFDSISEKCIAKTLKFILSLTSNSIKTKRNRRNSDNKLAFKGVQDNLLALLVSKRFSDVLLLPFIRAQLSLEESLAMLRFVLSSYQNESPLLDKVSVLECDRILINWGTLIIDASFQKFMLSTDESVVEVLREFSKVVEESLDLLGQINEVVPIVRRMVSKDRFDSQIQLKLISMYSIEQLKV